MSTPANNLHVTALAAAAVTATGALAAMYFMDQRRHANEAMQRAADEAKRATAQARKAAELEWRVAVLASELQEARREEPSNKSAPMLKRVVLTGGPCAGKTTGITQIKQRLEELGYFVLCAPEVATLLLTAGVGVPRDDSSLVNFQTEIVRLQLSLEDGLVRFAKASKRPCVILYDRGTMDSAAYVSAKQWEMLLEDIRMSTPMLRDQRYDCVVHFVTAADGAEEFYTLANNATRTETPEEAIKRDKATQEAWVGHERLCVIPNTGNFDLKMKRAVQRIMALVGAPVCAGTNRKFVLKRVPTADEIIRSGICASIQVFDVEQSYLVPAGNTKQRIRRKAQGSQVTYYHQQWVITPSGDESLYENQLTAREYIKMMALCDPNASQVTKTLITFLWNGLLWEINDFHSELLTGGILEVEVESETAEMRFPPILDVGQEVTQDERFDSYVIAKEQKKREEEEEPGRRTSRSFTQLLRPRDEENGHAAGS